MSIFKIRSPLDFKWLTAMICLTSQCVSVNAEENPSPWQSIEIGSDATFIESPLISDPWSQSFTAGFNEFLKGNEENLKITSISDVLDIYQSILNECLVADIKLTNAQESELERARKVLYDSKNGSPTKKLEAYKNFESQYEALQSKYKTASDKNEQQTIYLALKELNNSWELEGNKFEVLEAIETEKSLLILQPRSYVKLLKQRLASFEKPTAYLLINDSDLFSRDGWTMHSFPKSKSPIFTQEWTPGKTSDTVTLDSFKNKIIMLALPWLDIPFLTSNIWKMPAGHKYESLFTTNPDGIAQGQLSKLPSNIIFASDIYLKLSESDWKTITNNIIQNEVFTVGNLKIKGNHTSGKAYHPTRRGNLLYIQETYLIGFKYQKFLKTIPNPNPNYNYVTQ